MSDDYPPPPQKETIDRIMLNPEAAEFRPQNITLTEPPISLPAPPILNELAEGLARNFDSKPIQGFVDVYKAVLIFVAANPECFEEQIQCLREELFQLPEGQELTKPILTELVKMNIELAMIEPEYRNQSARVCLSLDSFLQEYTGNQDYGKCQELSQTYLKEKYVSFEMKQNSPNLVDELVVYAATLADYLTRLKNQGNAVEQLGKAMVEVLVEALSRKFTPENVKTLCDAVKMSCRTLLKVAGGNMREKFEQLREKLRETCLNDQVHIDVRSMILRLLEYIKYNEGKIDLNIQENLDTENLDTENLLQEFFNREDMAVRNDNEWDDFEDAGAAYDSPNNGYGYPVDGEYLAGQDLLSPSVAQDFEQFNLSENSGRN